MVGLALTEKKQKSFYRVFFGGVEMTRSQKSKKKMYTLRRKNRTEVFLTGKNAYGNTDLTAASAIANIKGYNQILINKGGARI